jgi:hypothetical protein
MSHDPARRLRQLQRVLLLIDLLSPLRRGATAAELARDISDELDRYSVRTIRRDLEALHDLGLVTPTSSTNASRIGTGAKVKRWRWVGWPGRSLEASAGAVCHPRISGA